MPSDSLYKHPKNPRRTFRGGETYATTKALDHPNRVFCLVFHFSEHPAYPQNTSTPFALEFKMSGVPEYRSDAGKSEGKLNMNTEYYFVEHPKRDDQQVINKRSQGANADRREKLGGKKCCWCTTVVFGRPVIGREAWSEGIEFLGESNSMRRLS